MKVTQKMGKLGVAALGMLLLSACSSTKSESVQELTKYDKRMGCTELELEMTEAEFFRDRAERNRGLSVRNVIMPLGYASTYMSADKAVEAANGRVAYLSRLYEVKGCAAQQQHMAQAQYGEGVQPVAMVSAYPAGAGMAYPAGSGMAYPAMRYDAPVPSMNAPLVRPLGY